VTGIIKKGETMSNMFDMLEGLSSHEEPDSREQVLQPPFSYPGSKARSLAKILPLLPYTGIYVEPFGGSAAVLLARRPCKLEVFNDRFAGVCAFYRCIRDPGLLYKLCERLELVVHSREEFIWCKRTWKNADDLVERAARWYYMTMFSFGRLGRNFGRSTSSKAVLCSLQDRLPLFPKIHERFKHVQVENQDAIQLIRDFDNHETVFYLDPPYIDADQGVYEHQMDHESHRRLLETIFSLKGYCAVSGYSNPLYNNQPWDNVHTWDSYVSIQSMAYTESNGKGDLKGQENRASAEECMWIKEAK